MIHYFKFRSPGTYFIIDDNEKYMVKLNDYESIKEVCHVAYWGHAKSYLESYMRELAAGFPAYSEYVESSEAECFSVWERISNLNEKLLSAFTELHFAEARS